MPKYSVIDHLLYIGDNPVSQYPAPDRGGKITPRLIVVHYTATKGLSSPLGWLTKRDSTPVSAHLIVDKDGTVYQLVPFNIEAWHAGKSSYDGQSGVNKFSIGIENVGIGDFWPDKQIEANRAIIEALFLAYPIEDVVGHVVLNSNSIYSAAGTGQWTISNNTLVGYHSLVNDTATVNTKCLLQAADITICNNKMYGTGNNNIFVAAYAGASTYAGTNKLLMYDNIGTMYPNVYPLVNKGCRDIYALADSAAPSVNSNTSVGYSRLVKTSGTTTITNLTNGVPGQIITIISAHAITITDGTNIFLNGSANFVMAATDTLTLVCDTDGKWYEISRSVN